jgi:squalene-hopene/tetraprenyl-beta-curcumene cyclase
LADHRVTRQAINFLVDSVRDDGSWPIDTNLATWVTTLSVNALGNRLPESGREPITNWLLGQQFREVHPYTNADPGGWSWTDLPGGVPDADDTPGAMLALLSLEESPSRESIESIKMSSNWLLSLQNRDGGWPTFCRGWGTLPFDRSSQDITAHVLRALMSAGAALPENAGQFEQPIDRGFEFLREQQREDGAWVPLWFGNQRVAGEQNPVYGTARVLMAWWDAGRANEEAAVRAREWLSEAQNPDGGWGGDVDTVSSVEETALAVEALLGCERGTSSEIVGQKQAVSGVEWLIARVEAGTWIKSEPIGFYFAKLWYFERLYPLIFTVSALRRALSAAKGKYDSLSDDMPLGA